MGCDVERKKMKGLVFNAQLCEAAEGVNYRFSFLGNHTMQKNVSFTQFKYCMILLMYSSLGRFHPFIDHEGPLGE